MAYKSINTPLDEEFAVIRDFWESKIVREGVFSLTVGGIKCDYTENTASDIKFSEKSGNTVCTRTFSYGQLLIRTEAVLYDDLPLTEWTVYVRNASDRITPRVTFNAFEHRFGCGYPTVYRHIGSDARPDDHMPFADPLGYCEKISVSPYGGRSSNHEWPYFSVALGNGSGFNLAIGWLGQWEANFERRDGLYVSAGQQRLDSVMLPGEEFRSPRILLQSWSYAGMPEKQAVRRSQNIFRRFMRKYNMPRYADGSIPTHGLAACSSHQFLEMTRSTAKDQIDFIDAYEKRGIRLDNWWMDAGWYEGSSSDWCNLGTWSCDKKRFPNGLREVSEYAGSKGMGTVIWHEPERVRSGSELFREHGDFLLSPIYPDGTHKADSDYRLLDFGNDAAREWITRRISDSITENGATVYRQDFNTEMLYFVDPSETEERKGAVENHYVCGMLRYWDDLVKEHPGLIIDECASGGRRDDIDAMKRALVFVRSDYLFEPVSQQCHMAWCSEWLPVHGTGIMLGTSLVDSKQLNVPYDNYALLSCISPYLNSCFDPRDDRFEWEKIRGIFDDWREYAERFSGDYYPLCSIDLSTDSWAAWQFNRPEEGDGVIQAFRRRDNPEQNRVFALNDLEPDAEYIFRKYGSGEEFTLTGADAMNGITVSLGKREAIVIGYTKSVNQPSSEKEADPRGNANRNS